MRFTLTIELGNEAMQTPDDVAEALRYSANRIENSSAWSDPSHSQRLIYDVNGNRVGGWSVTE